MAKRGYRGKHPYNDMKISSAGHGKTANLGKHTKEYNKTTLKYKYDYIRGHDGFVPQASATVVCHANIATNNAITLVSTTGLSKTYTAKTSNAFASNQFKHDDSSGSGEATNTATNLKSAIEHASGHNGELLVSQDGATLTITQKEPGQDGNTAITETFHSSATVPSAFTGG